jgi:hypothetical protein
MDQNICQGLNAVVSFDTQSFLKFSVLHNLNRSLWRRNFHIGKASNTRRRREMRIYIYKLDGIPTERAVFDVLKTFRNLHRTVITLLCIAFFCPGFLRRVTPIRLL